MTLKSLLEFWNRVLNEDPSREEWLHYYLEEAAKLLINAGPNRNDRNSLGPTYQQFYQILSEDDGTELFEVTFPRCGHVAHLTIPEIIAGYGFRQLLEMKEGQTATVLTVHSSMCSQCEAEPDFSEVRLAALLDN